MSNLRRWFLPGLEKILDLLLMVGAFGLASVAVLYETNGITLGEFLSVRVKVQNFILFSFLLLAWRLIFVLICHYDLNRMTAWKSEVIEAVQASSLGAFVLAMAAVFFGIRLVDPLFMVTFWAASCAGVALLRAGIAWFLSRPRDLNAQVRDFLIVGTNSRAVEFADRLELNPDFNFHVLGFVDDEWSGLSEFRKGPYALVSDFDGMADFLRRNVVDEVIVGLPMKSHYQTVTRITEVCEAQGVVVNYIPPISGRKVARLGTAEFGGQPLVTLRSGPMDEFALFVKRVLDFSASLVGLIVLSPLLIVTAMLIKLASPGPAIFAQERVGLNKRRFRLYKFRTMVVDAEKKQAALEKLNEVSGPVFKIKKDPRITPLGRWLRKTSIDELPQLFNVLKGDMSLVGPRPLPVRDYEGFHQDWHRRRFSVKPGIACIWQISGRSSIPFERWMELDMEYIDRWSLWLDFEILLGTIPAVLKGSGAA